MHKFYLFILTALFCITANAKEIVIKSAQDFEGQLKKASTQYRIVQKVDLKGMTIVFPQNCSLAFSEDGSIQNGLLIGNNTKIKSDKHLIIGKNITLEGIWSNTKVYGEWVEWSEDKPNNKSFSILATLCNGDKLTHLYTPLGVYSFDAVAYSAPILLPSNVYWHNASTLKLNGCNFTHYSLVLLHNVHDVIIDGGQFLGDVCEHIGTEGEWGHGIKCGGANRITLKNLTCSYFWGDGIDLIEGRDSSNKPTINCENIRIHNVKCLYNRRQGMSIEAAHHVVVTDCEFAYTGVPIMTKPAAGLDIEEWNADGHKMNHLTFRNCYFHDNVGYDMQSEPNWKMGNEGYLTFENNICFEKCTLDSCRVSYTNRISFQNCLIQDMNVHHTNDVSFTRCTIEKYSQSQNNVTPKLKRCKGKAIMLSYLLPISVVGISSIIGLGYFTYKKNEESYNLRNV